MKKVRIILLGLICSAFVAGCGEKAEDPATDKAFQAELAKAAAEKKGPPRQKAKSGQFQMDPAERPHASGSSTPASTPTTGK
jgi:hypothetical protein